MKYLNELTIQEIACRTRTHAAVKAAATFLTIQPLLILYPFLQKHFVDGLTISGVKD